MAISLIINSIYKFNNLKYDQSLKPIAKSDELFGNEDWLYWFDIVTKVRGLTLISNPTSIPIDISSSSSISIANSIPNSISYPI